MLPSADGEIPFGNKESTMVSRHERLWSVMAACVFGLTTACSGDPPTGVRDQASASNSARTASLPPQIGDWESKTYPVAYYAWEDGQLLLIATGPDESAARSGAVLAESATEVRVSMTLWIKRLEPGSYEFPVLRQRLTAVRTAQPLGNRTVIDAKTGKVVPTAWPGVVDALRERDSRQGGRP